MDEYICCIGSGIFLKEVFNKDELISLSVKTNRQIMHYNKYTKETAPSCRGKKIIKKGEINGK